MSTPSIEEASNLVGDDIAYWLRNPFMTPDMLADKVCWWIGQAIRAANWAAGE